MSKGNMSFCLLEREDILNNRQSEFYQTKVFPKVNRYKNIYEKKSKSKKGNHVNNG